MLKLGADGETGGAVDIVRSLTVKVPSVVRRLPNPITAPLLYTGGADTPRIEPGLASVIADTSRALLGPE